VASFDSKRNKLITLTFNQIELKTLVLFTFKEIKDIFHST